METRIRQVRGAKEKEWPLFLWSLLVAAVPWEPFDALSVRGEGECNWLRKTNNAAVCVAHTPTGVPGKQSAGLALGRNEGLGSCWSWGKLCHHLHQGKVKISSMNRFALPDLCWTVCGVTVLVIKKLFADKIFSSYVLWNESRPSCCNCT